MPPAKDSTSPQDKRHTAGRRRSDSTATAQADIRGQSFSGVTFRVRRLEPLLAWVLAGFTLWLNIVFAVSGLAFWLIVFFVACIGGWCRMYPARQQPAMFARAFLLVFGGLLLQISVGPGGATGPYALLPVLAVVFYAFLLSTVWAAVLNVWVLVCFGVSCWLTLSVVPWQWVLAQAGFLVLIPPLAMEFGRALRQSEENTESTLRDDRTQLYNEAGFFVHGAVLLAECRQRQRPFCIVLLNGADLLDVPGLLGRKVANDLFAQVVRGLASVSGEGIAARTESVEFGLLLPGVSAERAATMVKQQLGDPPKVEVKLNTKDRADAKPVTIVLDMAIAQATDKFQSLEELYDALHAQWVVTHHNKQESGKPVAKVPVLGPDDQRRGPRRAASPTVPMPLRGASRPWDK
jgi:GGDEF domain-containing protein